MKVKMYCIVARDSLKKMNGIRGKLCTQAGHAFLHAYWDSVTRFPHLAEEYQYNGSAYKITLVVDTVGDLQALEQAYYDKCGVSLVTDRGLTVFDEPTTTCLGIGPITEDLVGDDLKVLKTLT